MVRSCRGAHCKEEPEGAITKACSRAPSATLQAPGNANVIALELHMKPENSPTLAIFDLGGVVFQASFERAFEEWARLSGATVDGLRSKFNFGPHFEAFERGAISPIEFHQSLCEQLGLELTYDQFVAGWNSIYGEVFEDVSLSLQQ